MTPITAPTSLKDEMLDDAHGAIIAVLIGLVPQTRVGHGAATGKRQHMPLTARDEPTS